MSVSHYVGGAKQTGAAVRASHVFNREVRARVIVNAIVSTKTFRNATSPTQASMNLLSIWVQQIRSILPICPKDSTLETQDAFEELKKGRQSCKAFRLLGINFS